MLPGLIITSMFLSQGENVALWLSKVNVDTILFGENQSKKFGFSGVFWWAFG